MKRALIIVSILIVVIGVLVGVYFFFFAPSAHLTVSHSTTGFPSASTKSSAGQNDSSGAGTVVAPNLVIITAGPVAAGEVAFDIAPVLQSVITPLATTSSSTAPITPSMAPGDIEVRYVDRESGNIYAYRVSVRSLTRISNKTLPGVQEVSWLTDGSLAFMRFLTKVGGTEHINTYALPSNGLGGYFLEQDISQALIIGPSTLFTLNTGSGSSVGSTAHADGTNAQTLFTSPLTSIIARVAGSGVMAVTKATSELDGYAFAVTGNTFTPVLGPLRGLTILPSPSGKQVLFSYVDSNIFHMAILDLSTGSVTKLPLATLAEKCVWASDDSALYCAIPVSITGNQPDDWYQGVSSFSDRIWRIDLNTRLATLVLDPLVNGKVTIDAVNLTLDPNSQVLVFRNKIDSSLWAYSL